MGAYLVRRTVLFFVTVLGVSILIFGLMRIVPGNIADILFESSGFIDQVQKAKIEAELGLDKPLLQQYLSWIGGLAKGDFGSFRGTRLVPANLSRCAAQLKRVFPSSPYTPAASPPPSSPPHSGAWCAEIGRAHV